MLTIFPFRSLLLTLPHLVPKIKNAFYFGPYYHLTNENCLHGKQCTVGTLNADMIIKIYYIKGSFGWRGEKVEG